MKAEKTLQNQRQASCRQQMMCKQALACKVFFKSSLTPAYPPASLTQFPLPIHSSRHPPVIPVHRQPAAAGEDGPAGLALRPDAHLLEQPGGVRARVAVVHTHLRGAIGGVRVLIEYSD